MIDKKDPRMIVLAVLDESAPNGYIEKRLLFEEWRRANEVKDYHMDQPKVRQLQMQKSIMEEFVRECENEIVIFQ